MATRVLSERELHAMISAANASYLQQTNNTLAQLGKSVGSKEHPEQLEKIQACGDPAVVLDPNASKSGKGYFKIGLISFAVLLSAVVIVILLWKFTGTAEPKKSLAPPAVPADRAN